MGLYKTECVKIDGPFRTVDELELATLSWVHWFNEYRLHSSIGYLTRSKIQPTHGEKSVEIGLDLSFGLGGITSRQPGGEFVSRSRQGALQRDRFLERIEQRRGERDWHGRRVKAQQQEGIGIPDERGLRASHEREGVTLAGAQVAHPSRPYR